ncbi:hypothetical protein HQQ94_09615 [Shewanella sp. VB17]|uniref:hypothetical protein n=1 Tax=Shewanella sp. VB17 TaxID=2739432 RepID=UPI001567B7CA|nr:hypothetical protein [Shewanella sp. VB17]NRD73498.1 hypothetical protein [Shewanella sp. VB17]
MTIHDSEHLCSDCQKPLTGFDYANETHHQACQPDWHCDDDHDGDNETLEDIIHLQKNNLDYYQLLSVNSEQNQVAEELAELQAVDFNLQMKIRLLMETARDELCQHGFHTGISEDTLTFGDSEVRYVVGLTLHMADIPASDGSLVSQSMQSSNVIRFYRVAQRGDIECQFSNSKIQSRIFPINFNHDNEECEHEYSQGVSAIIQDFIRYILLSRRVEIMSLI